MTRRLLPVLFAALPMLSAGCANDLEENGSGVTPPIGMTVSFSADVQPIFDANCAFPGCHAPPLTDPPSMDLSAGQARASLVGVQSVESPLERVAPGDSQASYLLHKLLGTQVQAGGSGERMPLGGPYLPDAGIDLIRGWIDQGAVDN